ncbi:putative nonribosomal peptide protein [Eutypa lata UCREL1]|uniref:Putative nonribosomal peptide protein n=1 Tax=Eutypa lata (strain UCR-EL1) TaxID=1287681 RepID=M7SPY2_EUTLA|nr:putative nonribosomal peptide protein [Eutypa lata UCREL1]
MTLEIAQDPVPIDFKSLLDEIMFQFENNATNAQLKTISALSRQDLLQIQEWNPKLPSDDLPHVHDQIETWACDKHPADAIDAWDGLLSFREVHEFSSRLAHYLRDVCSLLPGDIVPFCIDRSAMSVVCMLAIMKSGAAFVPLNPSDPRERHEGIVETCGAKMVLVVDNDNTFEGKAVMVSWGLIDTLPSSQGKSLPKVESDALAYVIFTSGSTGRPKGVMVEQKSLSYGALVHTGKEYAQDPTCRVLQFASLTFDACLSENLSPLANGCCICIPDAKTRFEGLADYINAKRINWAFFTPSFFKLLNPDDVPGLRYVVVGGEAITPDCIEKWAHRIRLVNGYGPAENTIVSTARVVDPDVKAKNRSSIGKGMICNTWVVDAEDHTRLLPIGYIGELALQSPKVARGYLHDEEKTKAAFVDTPEWGRMEGCTDYDRMYKTGDLVKYMDDGSLLFCGRKDSQVKVRGQRLELAEVEWHIPADMIQYSAVLVPKAGAYKGSLLVEAWAHVLGIDRSRTPIDSSFQSLGGDSIRAITVLRRCRSENIQLDISSILKGNTIRELASKCGHNISGSSVAEKLDLPFTLSPIQGLYARHMPSESHYFNQSCLVCWNKQQSSTDVENAVREVVKTHSMLRTPFLMSFLLPSSSGSSEVSQIDKPQSYGMRDTGESLGELIWISLERNQLLHGGMPFFASRFYNGMDSGGHDDMEIVFNYMGHRQDIADSDAWFHVLPEFRGESGDDASGNMPRFSIFEISAEICDDEIDFTFTWPTGIKHEDRIGTWVEATRSILETVPDVSSASRSIHHGLPSCDVTQLRLDYDTSMVVIDNAREKVRDEGLPFFRAQLLYSVRASTGPMVTSNLISAWKQVVSQHEILRTAFIRRPGHALMFDQVVLGQYEPRIEVVTDREPPVDHPLQFPDLDWDEHEVRHRFTIFEGIEAKVLFEGSHALLDHVSLQTIFKHLSDAYGDEILPQDIAPFSNLTEITSLQSREGSFTFWRKLLGTTSKGHLCHSDVPAEAWKDFRRKRIPFSEDSSRELLSLSQSTSFTPALIFRFAYAVLIARRLRNPNIGFDYTVAGRDVDVPGIENIVGPCLNLIGCALEMDEQSTARQCLEELGTQFLESLPHQHVYMDFAAIHGDHKGLQRARISCFDTMLNFRPHTDGPRQRDQALQIEVIGERDPFNYAIVVEVDHYTSGMIDLAFSYWAEAVPDELVDELGRDFTHILGKLPETIDRKVGEILEI